VPVFYRNELIAWTVGLNHIVDVGGLQPGGASSVSFNVFTDGFTYPPTKTGTNFQQHKWWELHWKRRTRTGVFNILDDKMRTAGAVALHNGVLKIVEEFGVDYFRKGMKEIIERERRVLIQRIKTQAVPGKYQYLRFGRVAYKGVVGKLFASSDRNWLIHEPAEFQVLPDGRLFMDLEGLTSEDNFHINTYEPTVRMATSIAAWPMFAYAATINSSMMYMTGFNLSRGSIFNPQNPFAAVVTGLTVAAEYMNVYNQCLSHAYFARGFLEECFPGGVGGAAYGLDGVMADGFHWAGGDATLWTCSPAAGFPYKDGDHASVCHPNPAPDMGEVEIAEFIQPTNLNIGRRLIPDYCGHGKFRPGLGMGLCQLIVDPGQSLIISGYAASSGMGGQAMGRYGGYPELNDIHFFVHDTNMRQLIKEGKPYPTDFVEIRKMLRQGTLKAGSVEVYPNSTPNIQCKDGDLYVCATSNRCAWGDALERDFSLVEKDVKYGWITPEVASGVYGAVIDDKRQVRVSESNELRKQMRQRRKARSVDAKEWWKKEREQVLKREFSEEVYNMYADILKYDKFRREFSGMWQLPQDYRL
jgi:N-methylhydantoinase B/acetone carboxylase alpha subunit